MTPQNIQLTWSIAAAVAVITLIVWLLIEKKRTRHLRSKNQVASQAIASLAGLIDLFKVRAPNLAADPDVKRISDHALSVVNEHRVRLMKPSPELDLLARDLEALAGLERRPRRCLYTGWARRPQVAHK